MKKINEEKLTELERIAWAINQCLLYQLAHAKRRLRRIRRSSEAMICTVTAPGTTIGLKKIVKDTQSL